MHCNLTKSTTAHRRPIDRCSSRRKANRVWSSSSWFDSAVQNFRMTYSIFDTFYHLNVFWCIDQIAFQYLSTAAFPAHCSPVSGRSVAPAVRMPPVVQRGADVPWATAIRLTDRPLREDIDVERELPSSWVHQKRCNKNLKKSSKQTLLIMKKHEEIMYWVTKCHKVAFCLVSCCPGHHNCCRSLCLFSCICFCLEIARNV